MKRSLLVVCALASAAAADGHIQAPAGFTRTDDGAAALAEKTGQLLHFGGAQTVTTAEIYEATGFPVTLYVTTVGAKLGEGIDGAARAEVDDFLDAPKRAQMTSTHVSVERSGSRVDDAKKQVEADLTFKDGNIATTAHLVIAADAQTVVAVTGECVYAADLAPRMVDACEAAFATLDPQIALDKRVSISLAASAPEPRPRTNAPSMSDGTRTPLPPMILPSETKRTTDRRPVYVGLGIVVLAALFWWNRRRRERLDLRTAAKDSDG